MAPADKPLCPLALCWRLSRLGCTQLCPVTVALWLISLDRLKNMHSTFHCMNVQDDCWRMQYCLLQRNQFLHARLADGVLHGWFLIIHISFRAGVMGSISPEVSTCHICHISKASQGEWISCWCLPKTHTGSSSSSVSISLFFFSLVFLSWPSSEDFAGKKKERRRKAQQCHCWICCLTECRATDLTPLSFCIMQVSQYRLELWINVMTLLIQNCKFKCNVVNFHDKELPSSCRIF